MKFFITGSTGELGKAICSKLTDEGHEVIGFDLVESDFQHSNYHHIKGDINDESQIMPALNACDCIIHCAVYKGDYIVNLDAAFESNVLGTIKLYECIRKLNKAKVVLLSSAPVDKDFPAGNALAWKTHHGNDHTYDLTKRLQEEIARDYSETFNLQTIILRLGHVVNGKLNSDFKGRPLADLKYCLGGWVDYQDVVTACILAANYKDSNFEIFNIIGSSLKEDPFDIKRTIDKLGWKPIYGFNNN